MNPKGPGRLLWGYSTISSHHHSRRQPSSVGPSGTHGSLAGPVSRSVTVHAVFRSEAGPHCVPEPPESRPPSPEVLPLDPSPLSPEKAIRQIEKEIRRLSPVNFDAACVRIADFIASLPPAERARTVAELPGWIIARLAADGRCVHLCARLAFRLFHELAEAPSRDRRQSAASREHSRAFGSALLDACRCALDAGLSSVQPELDPSQEPVGGHSGQRQWTSTLKFIAELCRLEVFSRELLEICYDRLLNPPDSPRGRIHQETVEIAGSFLRVVGPELERLVGKKKCSEWIERLESWLEEPNLSSRSRFIILDVLEISSTNWKSTPRNTCSKDSDLLLIPTPPPQQQQQQSQQIPKISEIRQIVEKDRSRKISITKSLSLLSKPLVERYQLLYHSLPKPSKSNPTVPLIFENFSFDDGF